MSVDLPQPDGPSSATTSRGCTPSEMSSSTRSAWPLGCLNSCDTPRASHRRPLAGGALVTVTGSSFSG